MDYFVLNFYEVIDETAFGLLNYDVVEISSS